MVGEERTLADGRHVIGLFLRDRLQSDALPDLLAEIHSQEGDYNDVMRAVVKQLPPSEIVQIDHTQLAMWRAPQ